MLRRALLVAATLVDVGCAPELGDVPFSCAAEAVCPEGYVCRSTLCVRKDAPPGPERPLRTVWINASDLFWVPREGGGAALIVHDGFTEGHQGVYEILVSPDGASGQARLLLGYSDEAPRTAAVVALDRRDYGVVMLRHPPVDADELALEVLSAEREAPAGAIPRVTSLLPPRKERYLGGVEPPAISAVSGDGWIEIAWSPPSGGGVVELLRLERRSSRWITTRAARQALPRQILPLSADCLLWKSRPDELTVRVGFETFAVAKLDAAGELTPFAAPPDGRDVPLYAFDEELLLLRYLNLAGGAGQGADHYPVRYAVQTLAGDARSSEAAGVLQPTSVPYTATPYEDGALVVPFSTDPSFREVGVGWVSPSRALTRVAAVARSSVEPLYAARAFAAGGRVYVAWTEIHGAWLDLWLGVSDLALPRDPGAPGGAPASARPSPRPTRAMAWHTGRGPGLRGCP